MNNTNKETYKYAIYTSSGTLWGVKATKPEAYRALYEAYPTKKKKYGDTLPCYFSIRKIKVD